MAINMSYPKPRKLQYKFFEFARADNATVKCVLPKGATVVDVEVCQTVGATTAAASLDIGLGSNGDGGIALAQTTPSGLMKAGASIGTDFGQVLTADSNVTSTFVAGSSTAGGTGWVKIGYLPPLPNEGMFS